MQFYSTNNRQLRVSARDALLQGLAPDGGLFFPDHVPVLGNDAIRAAASDGYSALATRLLYPYFLDDISRDEFETICADAFSFPVALHELDEKTRVLELFHGPTCAFKDFGARFLARMMGHWCEPERETIVLVATSGDTGSAVAQGFFQVPGTRVVLLYPSGKVSTVQEQQMTTLGANVTALEVRGTFDDCQALVKRAFLDTTLLEILSLTSANSINIGRLLPQSVYYAWAAAQLETNIVFSVPSGNLGNVTAGVLAAQMGVPAERFIIAVNGNDTIPHYLRGGTYVPKPSVQTLSNAMDVGNPNNVTRLNALYENNLELLRQHIEADSVSDIETVETITSVFKKFGYTLDPHAAVGMCALERWRAQAPADTRSLPGIVLGTAHPAKFSDTVVRATGAIPELPPQLAACLDRTKRTIPLSNRYDDFAEYLRSLADA